MSIFVDRPRLPTNITYAGGREETFFELYGLPFAVVLFGALLTATIMIGQRRGWFAAAGAAASPLLPIAAGFVVAAVTFAGLFYLHPGAGRYAVLLLSTLFVIAAPVIAGWLVFKYLRKR